MNERIRELMAQAGFDPAAIERMGVMPQAEKFAKLVVHIREQVSLKNSHRNDDMGAIIARQIVDHFGVKE